MQESTGYGKPILSTHERVIYQRNQINLNCRTFITFFDHESAYQFMHTNNHSFNHEKPAPASRKRLPECHVGKQTSYMRDDIGTSSANRKRIMYGSKTKHTINKKKEHMSPSCRMLPAISMDLRWHVTRPPSTSSRQQKRAMPYRLRKLRFANGWSGCPDSARQRHEPVYLSFFFSFPTTPRCEPRQQPPLRQRTPTLKLLCEVEEPQGGGKKQLTPGSGKKGFQFIRFAVVEKLSTLFLSAP